MQKPTEGDLGRKAAATAPSKQKTRVAPKRKRPGHKKKSDPSRGPSITTFQMIVGLVGVVFLLVGAALTGELKNWRVYDS